MNREKIADFVIDQTTRGVGSDDILLEICRRWGISWSQAETLVDEILADHTREVSLRRNLVLGTIAAFTIIAGIVIAAGSGMRAMALFAGSELDWEQLDLDLLVRALGENYMLVAELFFAAVLIVAGCIGVWRTVGDFFLSLFDRGGS